MEQIGNLYYYENRSGHVKNSILTGITPAWYIFSNGEWVERYRPIYNTEEDYRSVCLMINAIEKTVCVPDVIHVPNRFLK